MQNKNLRIACILDEFSYEGFKHECKLEQLKVNTWKEQLIQLKPSLLLVESAWKGVDKEWRNKIANVKSYYVPSVIQELINYCKQNKIITVFWNKEDPPNFEYFIDTAKLFDYIFTTDQESIPTYRKYVGHNNIFPLPFAAQPQLHNPINSQLSGKKNIAFAGTYYPNKHHERMIDMKMLLSAAQPFGLDIYDRMFHFKNYHFPAEFQSNVVGTLDYTDLCEYYKKYKIFLNVNSVKNSSTMFSRRVCELLACGTNIVSSYSKALENMFADVVPLCRNEMEVKEAIKNFLTNTHLSREYSLRGIRQIYSKHLYRHRLNEILDKIGFKMEQASREVTLFCHLSSPEKLDALLKCYWNQTWNPTELIIVTKGWARDSFSKSKALCSSDTSIKFINLPLESTIGKCYNVAIKNATYNFVSKIHENCYYGSHYVEDLMHAFEYSGADLVGKGAYFEYLSQKDTLIKIFEKKENKFVKNVHGSAFICKKDIMKKIMFQENLRYELEIDKCFFNACQTLQVKIYSSDMFNFLRYNNARVINLKNGNVEKMDKPSKPEEYIEF
ncbi:spore maturation protein CgeB [Neobacillus bataviensis]|uniref:Spore maturation protein CgeB n=1 Tax=Neobacillus bataviensis TaxID=220685 RepID=A0A561DC40_9BACI|nr:glycosyltransferase [Neobacillus bataviensis]TWE00957.1 spore maturation protein CgeB [Neobacillus bataviensis]